MQIRGTLAILVGLFIVQASAAPNIVLIISDDAGFSEFGFMDTFTGEASPVPTPHLDALRARGVLLTSAYTSSVCSPSRACLVTGMYSQRIGYEYNINNLTDPDGSHDGLQSSVTTMFERMGELGYTTGAVGKWHLGAIPDVVSGTTVIREGNRPPRQGVDEFFGILKGSRNYSVGGVSDVGILREMSLDVDGLEVDVITESTHAGEYVTNTFGQGAVDFIDRHHADTDPFFLYVSFTAPHAPIGASPDRGAPGVSSNYGSMVYTMDKEIGRIMAKLADPDGNPESDDSIVGDTLVVFLNDNGGANGIGTSNAPLRNWKGSPFEGGVRVPMIFAGAGVTAPAGSTYDRPVHSIDLLPTFFEAGGGMPLIGIDGVNLFPFLNGARGGDPHAFLTMRSESEIGMRMGDWKLVKNGRGGRFQLFDLAGDLAETSDVAGSNPEIIQAMVRELTRFEARCDKPRHHRLGAGPDSINLNDRFRLAPAPGSDDFIPKEVIVDGSRLNGGFEENDGPSGTILRFDQVAQWVNLTGDDSQVCARDNLSAPTAGAWNGVGSDSGLRQFALDSGYTIAAGDQFLVGYDWRDASGWNAAGDRMRVRLFTTLDDTITGTRVEFFSQTSEPSSQVSSYQSERHVSPVVDPGLVGRRLFLVIDGVNGGGGAGFARFDNVRLATAEESTGESASLDWSDGGVWVDGDSGQADTMLDLDAFPGAELEFPVTDDFSYTATNDLTRPSGLDFMLHKIVLSGAKAGAQIQSATIDGNAVIFTRDLGGDLPSVEVGATGAFSYAIENEVVLYDDLRIGGAGGVRLELSGAISDFAEPRGLSKSGGFPMSLIGDHSYKGETEILEGELSLQGRLQTPLLTVAQPAILNADGAIAGDLEISGSFEWFVDGSIFNHLEVAGELRLDGGVLRILGPVSLFDSGAVSYGSLSGAFSEVIGLPVGYSVDYGFDDGGGPRQIAIVQTTPYLAWAQGRSGLDGAASIADFDANDDGVPNGVAFFLGAADANEYARDRLPTVDVTAAAVEFSYGEAPDTELGALVQYSHDLQRWETARAGVDGVTITTEGSRTSVSLPLDLAVDGRLHVRLAVLHQ